MKKTSFLALLLGAMTFSLSTVSCSDSDGNGGGSTDDNSPLTQDEITYSKWVGEDLYRSSLRLVANWGGATTEEQNEYLEEEDYAPEEDYGEAFMSAGESGNTKYKTVVSATTAIIAGCNDIIDEVAHSKIGAPYDGSDVNYIESPHSHNSIQDFYDNIKGCLFAVNGANGAETEQENSLMKYSLEKYPTEANAVKEAFATALAKIKLMKDPFVQFYSDKSAGNAIAALEVLDSKLKALSAKISAGTNDENELKVINKTYVEKVVRPTYEKLMAKSQDLQGILDNLSTQEQLNNACAVWKDARQYWEWSEAFLFGPAHNFGIDPHIDTWPFDVKAFNTYLKNNTPLSKSENERIVKDAIRNGTNLTGFHALEYLIFRNGSPRTFSSK